jgi:hypothetical protein
MSLEFILEASLWLMTHRFDPSVLDERNMLRGDQPRFSYNLKHRKEYECSMKYYFLGTVKCVA